jgi:hypothetical protein
MENLPENIKNRKKPLKIDLVLSGGAFNGSYILGALYFLKELEREKYIIIKRISTCSVSSFLGLLYLTDNLNYGGNIYLDSDENRPFDTGVGIAQGNKTNVMIADLQLGYLLNPVTNMRLFGNFMYRNFDPTAQTASTVKSTTTWISIGLRSDLFNWYFDY